MNPLTQLDIEKKARKYAGEVWADNAVGAAYKAFLAGASAREEEYRALVERNEALEKHMRDLLKCYQYLMEVPHPIPQNSIGSPIVQSTLKLLKNDK